MKSLSDLIHKTPWWALFLGGLAVVIALAAFVTPYHIIDYRKDAATAAEKRAIKREIDNAFADNAIEIARNVLLGMRGSATDPRRRDELDQALESLDAARAELREAGAEVLRAKREAASEVSTAVQEASAAIRQAQKDASRALKEAGIEDEAVKRSLEQSLEAARKAEEDAKRATEAAAKSTQQEFDHAATITEEKGKRRLVIRRPGRDKPMVDIEVDAGGASATGVLEPPAPPLPPELRAQIREDVRLDLYRIGVGAGLLLIFVPLFILTTISKFFIDRSRAAQRLADLKRKEAEYHRMSQQVTEAKLSALQAQVEPHFLYNTLASVQALTEVDPAQANAMTGHLIQYLRNALPKMRESVSTVGQEIELVRAYLNILQMRMGKRLSFDIEVTPPELADAAFPPLMLPSLVENAIKHGLEPQREGGRVSIRAEQDGDRLRMVVADTGRGFGETLGAGVGLANIRERLAAMYGDRAKLTLEANAPQGVVATIEVPRGGARAAAGAAAPPGGATASTAAPGIKPSPPPQPEAPPSAARRTLSAMGSAERAWRKGLSFAFVGLVVVAAILAGLGIVGVTTGIVPVHMGGHAIDGLSAALLGTAGIAVAFVAVVLAIAIVLGVVYGLGFLFAGLAIFIPLVVLVAIFPVLSPFLLVALGIWWLVRRGRRKREAQAAPATADAARAP